MLEGFASIRIWNLVFSILQEDLRSLEVALQETVNILEDTKEFLEDVKDGQT